MPVQQMQDNMQMGPQQQQMADQRYNPNAMMQQQQAQQQQQQQRANLNNPQQANQVKPHFTTQIYDSKLQKNSFIFPASQCTTYDATSNAE